MIVVVKRKKVMKNYGESIKNLITNKRLRGMVNI